MKLTKDEKDSLIVSAVLEFARNGKYYLRRGSFIGDKSINPNMPRGCCAIGAGVLFLGLGHAALESAHACDVFAKAYDVSWAYAVGVSDGFEGGDRTVPNAPSDSDDYRRGVSVGEIIEQAVLSDYLAGIEP